MNKLQYKYMLRLDNNSLQVRISEKLKNHRYNWSTYRHCNAEYELHILISGKIPVAYYAPQELIEYVYNRDFWKDTESDILFGRIDIVLNGKTHVKNLETLEEITSSETRGGFVSIMIHEQYFYSDYINYREDFETRVVDACRFLKEKGYEGRHICRAADI